MKLILPLFLLVFVGCGSPQAILGEDHGNIAAGELGIVLVESEHPTGWGEPDCFFCHNMENVHRVDRSSSGVNMAVIRSLTEEEGLSICSTCHGDNGVQ